MISQSINMLLVLTSLIIPLSYAGECFRDLLHRTQDCSNTNLFYTGTEGGGSGFGSQFHYYFVNEIKQAVLNNQRMIFVYGKPFENDCEERKGWACYLNFPCKDSVISMDEFRSRNVGELFEKQNEDLHQPTKFKNAFIDSYRKYAWNILPSGDRYQCVDWGVKWVISHIDSISAKWLYRLNSKTKAWVKEFNSIYSLPPATPYISMQIRATDKKSEMDPHQWLFMNNMTEITNKVEPYILSSGIKYLYISTDTCDYYQQLSKSEYLGKEGIVIMSPCAYKSDPRRNGPEDTLRLIAEIEMMKGGLYFFGLMKSNLCSLIYLLRQPKLQKNTINFIMCNCIERIELFDPNGGYPRRLRAAVSSGLSTSESHEEEDKIAVV